MFPCGRLFINVLIYLFTVLEHLFDLLDTSLPLHRSLKKYRLSSGAITPSLQLLLVRFEFFFYRLQDLIFVLLLLLLIVRVQDGACLRISDNIFTYILNVYLVGEVVRCVPIVNYRGTLNAVHFIPELFGHLLLLFQLFFELAGHDEIDIVASLVRLTI